MGWQIVSFWLPFFARPYIPIYHKVKTNTLPISLAWYQTFDRPIDMKPIGNSQIVVALHGGTTLTAINNETGKIQWEYQLPNKIRVIGHSQHVFDVSETAVIISTHNTNLIALNANTGKPIWQVSLLFPTNKTVPNIYFINKAIIVTAPNAYGDGYVAMYHPNDGKLLWEKPIPAKTLKYQFPCPSIPIGGKSSPNSTCFVIGDYLTAVSTDLASINEANRMIGQVIAPFPYYSSDHPSYQEGFLFSNPNPRQTIYVYDSIQRKQFTLPTNCTRDGGAEPVSHFDDQILVVTGCNEMYVLTTDTIRENPSWIKQSNLGLLSPLVTPDGRIGYVLTEKGEILAIDLSNGGEIGQFTTTPRRLTPGTHINSLTTNPPYLYATMDRNTLFVFK
jgi:outer membrane protein assembly factor BamB